MPPLSVGQRYHLNVVAWTEGVHVLGLSAQRMEILVAFTRPTEAEVQAFRDTRNVMVVGLASHGSIVILLAKIPDVFHWAACPAVHLRPPSTLTGACHTHELTGRFRRSPPCPGWWQGGHFFLCL